jgi:hypothetical protein
MALPEVKVRVTADTAQAEAGLSRVDKAVTTTASKTTAATAKTRGMSGAMGKLGSVSTTTRSRIQQTSFQLQDIIVQLQGGTKASTALSQQLPQMAGAFGAVGAAIGVGVALGIPAVALAMNAMRTASVTLEERMEALEELSDKLTATLDILKMSVSELSEEYAGASERVRELAVLQAGIQIAAATAAFAGQAEMLKEVSTQFITSSDSGMRFESTIGRITDAFGTSRNESIALEAALQELYTAEGFEAQQVALEGLSRLMREFGVDASKLPPEFAKALSEMIDLSRETDGARAIADKLVDAVSDIATEFSDAEGFAVLLNDAAGGLAESLAPGLAAAKSLADELWDAAKSLAIIGSAGTQGRGGAGPGGPMGAVEQFLAGRDPSTRNRNSPGDPDAPSGRGKERNPAIEALLESLKTEDEILEEWRANGLQTLAEANAEELAALGGHSEAKLRLEAEYQDRLNGIKRIGGAADLATTLSAGASILAAVGQHNDKAMRMAKVFSAAKALINTMEGASEALKLPFPANLAAAATVISSGMGFISAIKGVSSSGGGGGVPSASSAPSIPSAAASGGSGGGSGGSGGGSGGGSPTNVSISLQGGDMFGRDQVIGLINSINEAVEDGAIVRLV